MMTTRGTIGLMAGGRGRRWLIGAGATGAVLVIALGLYLFQPWRLFTTTVADERIPVETTTPAADPTAAAVESGSPPTDVPPAGPVELSAGTFITHEHETSGTARIVQLPDGSRSLLIEGLATSDGPDLHVWLTDQPVREGIDGWHVFDDGAYLDLGALRGNVGDLVYPIPADADLSALSSVSIWCARFAVSFGAAALS